MGFFQEKFCVSPPFPKVMYDELMAFFQVCRFAFVAKPQLLERVGERKPGLALSFL